MIRPEKIVFSEEATFSFIRGEILIPILIEIFGISAVLVTSETSLSNTLADLVLPLGALSVGWLAWVGLLALISFGHRIGERRAIDKMLSGQIWECWQFSSLEWRALVETECELISPKNEGLKAYMGAVYSSIFGLVFAAIMVAVGIFAGEGSDFKTVMGIGAILVFLVFLGAGLFQPIFARYKADRFCRKALDIAEPRVWFAPGGIYHEALGFTSLKELIKVTDRTRSNQTILFSLAVSTESSVEKITLPFNVPAGCEERAVRLVLRYRKERLRN